MISKAQDVNRREQPDPFLGQGSIVISNNELFVVNAGSDSFSVFDIDPTDPARPTFKATYPSNGNFPVSLAVNSAGDTLCVLNGGLINGFSCYAAGSNGWTHKFGWDRNFGLNLTTPPHGSVIHSNFFHLKEATTNLSE